MYTFISFIHFKFQLYCFLIYNETWIIKEILQLVCKILAWVLIKRWCGINFIKSSSWMPVTELTHIFSKEGKFNFRLVALCPNKHNSDISEICRTQNELLLVLDTQWIFALCSLVCWPECPQSTVLLGVWLQMMFFANSTVQNMFRLAAFNIWFTT